MQQYILLIDRDERTLSVAEIALKYFYGGEVVTARSPEEATAALDTFGRPEIVFIEHSLCAQDSGLLSAIRGMNVHTPIISCVESSVQREEAKGLPGLTAFIDKPLNIDEFTATVKSFSYAPSVTPSHVPVKMKTVLEFANGDFDYYLGLSKDNFVKLLKKGDRFNSEDVEKLRSRKIFEVYVRASESHDFLRVCERGLRERFECRAKEQADPSFALGVFEQVESIAKAFGWKREVVLSAQKLISSAVNVLNKNHEISKALRARLKDPSSGYSRHIGVLAYLNCILSNQLGYANDSGQLKLVMASLLHDLALEESHYENLKDWNQRAAELKDRNLEVVQYRLHPLEAARVAQRLDVLPPDVDSIILQHHERPDGNGFPRGLTANRIGQLPAFFIMMEELTDFIGDGVHMETSFQDYLTWGEASYVEGHFGKIFSPLKQKIKQLL